MPRIRKTQPGPKRSLALTDAEAKARQGRLIQEGTKFQCGIGKCKDKTTRIKNTKRDVSSHITKLHAKELKGVNSSYQNRLQCVKPGLAKLSCPTCRGLSESDSRLDGHRRRHHEYKSPPEAKVPKAFKSSAKPEVPKAPEV
ncbi:hypothetical protein UCREL1_4060 [Eutypa lata UCREL1]|uniref:Uncharacterized protein n=1 Tax=Eutypa lata (strain UCR-EL1) TaxID=1287681 RepID=M7SX67_EUTLA|nr:hypothetical protein UCREL1_4060 [Eutypa lata UCREL1]